VAGTPQRIVSIRDDSGGYGNDVPFAGRMVAVVRPERHAVHNPQNLRQIIRLGLGRMNLAKCSRPSGVDPVYAFDNGVNLFGGVFNDFRRIIVVCINVIVMRVCLNRCDRKKPSADFDEVSGDRSILVG
jgi:hypothetical protein